MKPIIGVALAVLLGASVFFLTACQRDELSRGNIELGLNGSFEVTDTGYPVNWAFFPNPESSDSLQVIMDPEHVVEGKHSLRVVTKETDKTTGFRSRRISVQPGKEYRIAMSVRTEGCTLKVNRIVGDGFSKKNLRSGFIVDTGKASAEWNTYQEVLAGHCTEDLLQRGPEILAIELIPRDSGSNK